MCPFLANQLINLHLSPFRKSNFAMDNLPAVSKFSFNKSKVHIVRLTENKHDDIVPATVADLSMGLPLGVGHGFRI